ncbi:MAG: hypothetical protein KJO07_10915, partial [Deltaproteobacteria bacterium]|nr:hypothetical protein [Deltaproteobacteria bacterium]
MLDRFRLLAAAALLLPACGGDQGLDGDPGEPGEGGASSLVTTTELGTGDSDCPFGGNRIDIGLDNGDGGETAGDGVLGAGEIDSTSFLCNGEDEDPDRPLDGPAGPAGQFVIDLSGGDGSTNAGGSGGSFETYMSSGSGGGHLKIFATGLVDASFTVPSVTPDLGDNPETVTADATVFERAVADNSGLVAGSLVRRTTDDTLYRFNGATDDAVTGLSVAAGVTLTFERATSNVSISLPGGLINAGTLTTDFAGDGVTRNPLSLNCSTFVGAEGSSIDLSGGAASTGNDGGGGGDLSLAADDAPPAGPGSGGVIVNQGTINTAGGQGDSGGSGGNVYLQGNQSTYNTGAVDTNGGVGTAGTGGSGGGSYFFATSGVWNSGDISASGGVGATSGGSASDVNIDSTGG